MAMWRCPHCGTPQAETSRCWVCRRSSTSCGTCRHFRRAIAGQLGYCGLDRRRQPLRGDELRGCWTAPPAVPDAGPPPGRLAPRREERRLDFVPVDAALSARADAGLTRPAPASAAAPSVAGGPVTRASTSGGSVAPAAPASGRVIDPLLGFWAEDD